MEISLRKFIPLAPSHERFKGRRVVVFSDLDGSLLNHKTYDFDQAKPAMKILKDRHIPINIVASKTKAEIEEIESKMGIFKNAPFIAENGGAIYIPKNFFSFNIYEARPALKISETDSFTKIEFGKPYEEVRMALKTAAKNAGLKVTGIGDVTDVEFALDSGLTLNEAHLAKMREYQEGFKIDVPFEQLKVAQDSLKKEVEALGFFMSRGGRYFQIMGFPAKVEAVKTLIDLYRLQYPDIITVGLGDAQADLDFLEICDVGYLINNPNNAIPLDKVPAGIRQIDKPGPEGWNEAIMKFLEENLIDKIKS